MPSMGQILLFAVSAFLCLIPGDALLCRTCVMMMPGAPCLPAIACVAEPGIKTCHTFKVYSEGVILQKILSCKTIAAARCGSATYSPHMGMTYEHKCCDESDFCNENL